MSPLPANGTVEVSANGRWKTVPSLRVNGHSIVVQGRWPRLAVVHDEEWIETELEDPEACVEALRRQPRGGLRADILTFSQKLPATVPKYRYPMEWDSIAAARVSSFKAWWDGLPQESRKNVRRAEKRGVVVRIKPLDECLVRGIMDVNNDSPVRQRTRFVHHGKTADQVTKDQSSFSDRSAFVCAYLGDELIGFLKLVFRGDIASILQILPRASRADARPANAMIARAIELCEEKGLPHLTYGKYSYGNQGTTSLMEFKARNGFAEVLVPRYYIPLTRRGRLGMALGLHRELVELLPRGAIQLGVALRKNWYNLTLSKGRCSSTVEQPNRNRQMERSSPPAGSTSPTD